MTNAWLTDFHAAAHVAFLDAGLADEGSYSVQGAAGINCRLYVDRDQASAELAGVEITSAEALIRVLRADVSVTPRVGDVITIGSESFRVARRAAGKLDEQLWWLVCQA